MKVLDPRNIQIVNMNTVTFVHFKRFHRQMDGQMDKQMERQTDRDLQQYVPDLNWWYHVQISVIKVTGGNIMQSIYLLSKT